MPDIYVQSATIANIIFVIFVGIALCVWIGGMIEKAGRKK